MFLVFCGCSGSFLPSGPQLPTSNLLATRILSFIEKSTHGLLKAGGGGRGGGGSAGSDLSASPVPGRELTQRPRSLWWGLLFWRVRWGAARPYVRVRRGRWQLLEGAKQRAPPTAGPWEPPADGGVLRDLSGSRCLWRVCGGLVPAPGGRRPFSCPGPFGGL